LNAVSLAREIIGRVLWALVTIGATLAVGRFFCAYVCPMGAVGLTFWTFFSSERKNVWVLRLNPVFGEQNISCLLFLSSLR